MAQKLDIIGALAVFAVTIYVRSLEDCTIFSDAQILAVGARIVYAPFDKSMETAFVFWSG